jgi:excisionase family DNA binding protein
LRIATSFLLGGVTLAEDLLTIDEVAAELRLHPDTIRRFIRQKKLTAIRISATSVRVRRTDLQKFIDERLTDKDETL